MGIGEWTAQNWFDLFSALGIAGGLLFTAVSFVGSRQRRAGQAGESAADAEGPLVNCVEVGL